MGTLTVVSVILTVYQRSFEISDGPGTRRLVEGLKSNIILDNDSRYIVSKNCEYRLSGIQHQA